MASSLLPAPGDNKSYGWVVGDHDLWYTPLKPLSQFHNKEGLDIVCGSWAGQAPGISQEVTATVLVPHRPQQQEQGQGQEVLLIDQGMPGRWQVVATASGRVTCAAKHPIRLRSSSLFQQLEPLVADHFMLRAQYDQVGGNCRVTVCFEAAVKFTSLIDGHIGTVC